MVTVFLRGGLGNQMFQYAVGLNLAKKNNTRLTLDTVFLSDRFPRKEFAYRTYDLGVFKLDPRVGSGNTLLSKVASALPIPGVWLALDLAFIRMRDVFDMQKLIKEKNEHEFDPAIPAVGVSALLWGRWQNEKYFKDIAGDVRRAFELRVPLAGEAARIAEEIARTNSISIHVRRGDYAAFKSVETLHGKTDLHYYDRAVAYVAARVKKPHFFVFSDDVQWCKENLKLSFPMTFVERSAAGPHDASHMELMSLCKHNIITNSTFSWWGAWRNGNAEKIVIAPERWYADPAQIQVDVVPNSWIRL